MTKTLCLGNEFIKEDSLAKKIADDLNAIKINNSFQLLPYLQSKELLIIIDVVENLKEPTILKIEDLKQNKIVSAHDLDASFFLQLIKKPVKIIGLPQQGNIKEILKKVGGIISSS